MCLFFIVPFFVLLSFACVYVDVCDGVSVCARVYTFLCVHLCCGRTPRCGEGPRFGQLQGGRHPRVGGGGPATLFQPAALFQPWIVLPIEL